MAMYIPQGVGGGGNSGNSNTTISGGSSSNSFTAEDLLSLSNAGDADGIIRRVSGSTQAGPESCTIVLSASDLGLPSGGSVRLVISEIDYDVIVSADANGTVTFEVPLIQVESTITVELCVMDASDTVLWYGSKTQQVRDGVNLDVTLESQVQTPVSKIGSKAAPDAVGDIVFNDGSAEPYSAGLTLTDEQKAAAVAVIFDAASKKGVGLNQGTNLKWAASGTTGSTKNIPQFATVRLSGTDSDPSSAVFSGAGAADGSGSLAIFRAAVGATSGVALNATDYGAWAFVEGYAATAGLTGTYASGWYMPSIAELCTLYQAKTTVNYALNTIGATWVSDSYWSCSQLDTYGDTAWTLDMWTGFGRNDKYNEKKVCVIRAF